MPRLSRSSSLPGRLRAARLDPRLGGGVSLVVGAGAGVVAIVTAADDTVEV